MKCFVPYMFVAYFLILKNITIASPAEINVIGISNQNPTPKKEIEKFGDVVNININNYCSETSVILVKECYCVPPSLCNDKTDEQIQTKSKSANFVFIKCNQQEVCCFNVSFTRGSEIPSSSPATTEKITTTTPAPEYVTEIVTTITIINVTKSPTTVADTVPASSTTNIDTSSTSSSTVGTTLSQENASVEDPTTAPPTEEDLLGKPTKEETTVTSQFDVEIINEQSLSERLCGTRKLYDRKISRIMTPVTTPAAVGEFPWTVNILEKDSSNNNQFSNGCMGSLVRSGVVLTAGNCIQRDPKNYVVRAGTINPLRREVQIQPWQQNDVHYVTYHPQYLLENGQGGIALLFLKGDFIINDYVNVICLPSNFNFSTMICMSSATHMSTGNLQRVSAKLENNDTCKTQLRQLSGTNKKFFGEDNSQYICASTSPDREQTNRCGVPLVCQLPGDNKFTQVGIGLSCGKHNAPNVYHNIGALNNWITSEVSLK